jgi:hypothetical protein
MADTRCSLGFDLSASALDLPYRFGAIDRRSATTEDASGWVCAGDVVLQMLDGLLLL